MEDLRVLLVVRGADLEARAWIEGHGTLSRCY